MGDQRIEIRGLRKAWYEYVDIVQILASFQVGPSRFYRASHTIEEKRHKA